MMTPPPGNAHTNHGSHDRHTRPRVIAHTKNAIHTTSNSGKRGPKTTVVQRVALTGNIKTGQRRQVAYADLQEYKHRDDARRHAAAVQLTELGQELGNRQRPGSTSDHGQIDTAGHPGPQQARSHAPCAGVCIASTTATGLTRPHALRFP